MVTAWKQLGCAGREKMVRMARKVILPAQCRAAQHPLHWQPFVSPNKATFLLCPAHPNLIAGLSHLSFPPFLISSLLQSQKWPCPSPLLLLHPYLRATFSFLSSLLQSPALLFLLSTKSLSWLTLFTHSFPLLDIQPHKTHFYPCFTFPTTFPLLLNIVAGWLLPAFSLHLMCNTTAALWDVRALFPLETQLG